jgi:hypothetical protein
LAIGRRRFQAIPRVTSKRSILKTKKGATMSDDKKQISITGKFEETTGKIQLDAVDRLEAIARGGIGSLVKPPGREETPTKAIVPGWPIPTNPLPPPSSPAGDYPDPSQSGGNPNADDGVPESGGGAASGGAVAVGTEGDDVPEERLD